MDWQGIEWVVPVYGVLMLLVPVYGFISFRQRVKHKVLTKARAFLYFTGFVISPVAIYAIFFLVLVGLEEVAKTAIITEGLARSVLILIGLGLVVWLVSLIIFGMALTFIGNSASSPKIQPTPKNDGANLQR
jgi:hypothetical protein